MEHVLNIINTKLKLLGRTDEEIHRLSIDEKIKMSDNFFGGGHELIITRRHFKDHAQWDAKLLSSGDLTPDEHYMYMKFTIESKDDIYRSNRYVRYVSVFQNWLGPAGASFDHLHKQA